MQALCKASRASGTRRMMRKLRAEVFEAGRKRTRQLMSLLNLQVKHRRRSWATTSSKHPFPVAENLLNRHCNPPERNQVWATDSTHLWINKGWLYLAVVLDLCSRRVMGWTMDRRYGQGPGDSCFNDGSQPEEAAAKPGLSGRPRQPVTAMPASTYLRRYGIHHSMSC